MKIFEMSSSAIVLMGQLKSFLAMNGWRLADESLVAQQELRLAIQMLFA